MVRFINKLNGHDMWVADDRIEEYKAAGHKPAVSVDAEEPIVKPEAARKTEDAESVAASQQEEKKAPPKKSVSKRTAAKK